MKIFTVPSLRRGARVCAIALSVLSLSHAFSSCRKTPGPTDNPAVDPADTVFPDKTVDVYLLGRAYTSTGTIITLWKNGLRSDVTDSSRSRLTGGIAVSGSTVYIAGTEYVNSTMGIAKYWKNGQEFVLSDGMTNASATAIALVNNDVYVVGWIGTEAVCWKNGTVRILPEGSSATDIAVSGTDVYISGIDHEGGLSIPKYWKNGVSHPMNYTGEGRTRAIAVSDGDVYVAGYFIADMIDRTRAKYWHNGIETFLDEAQGRSMATGITVAGNDLYICGNKLVSDNPYQPKPGYWKNGMFTALANQGRASSVAKSGDFLYVAGVIEPMDTGTPIAALWINDKLSIQTDRNVTFDDVVVAKK